MDNLFHLGYQDANASCSPSLGFVFIVVSTEAPLKAFLLFSCSLIG